MAPTLLAVLGVLATSVFFAQEGMLQGLARQARAEGRQSAKVFNFLHNDVVGESLEYYLRHHSIAYVTAAMPVMTASTPNDIASWQRATLHRMVWSGPAQSRDYDQPGFCASLPRPAALSRLAREEIGIVAPGGTVDVDGIAVTIETGYALNLEQGRKYLVVGLNCGKVLYLNGGMDHLFEVDAKNRVSWNGHDKEPWVQTLLELKTVTVIERYLLALR